MPNVFEDQRQFMAACGQTIASFDEKQAKLYFRLIVEEYKELCESLDVDSEHALYVAEPGTDIPIEPVGKANTADALLDIIVVSVGMLLSLGLPAEVLWREVVRSNMAKVDPLTGKVVRREDGKILKPEGWTPPNLELIIRLHNEAD